MYLCTECQRPLNQTVTTQLGDDVFEISRRCVFCDVFHDEQHSGTLPRHLWAMKFKLDGHIDHLSIRRTKKHCIHDFEESFGQQVTPEFISGWEAVKVMVIEL